MQIIKPAKLSLVNKTYGLKGNRFTVAVMSFFRLGAENQLLAEREQWPNMTSAMADGTMPDLGFAKPKGEYLVTGKAFAPQGETVTKMTVSVQFGSKKKKLKIIGDRLWNGLLFAPARRAQPFESMPVSYERAYGAEEYKLNPQGRGVIKRKYKDPETGLYKLPNVYLPNESTFAGGKRSVAGFGPLGIDWKQREKFQGTYDKKWMEKVHPAFPNDTKQQLFNSAPVDQQLKKGFITPGESYEICGMHPEHDKIEGNIPDLRARAFIEQEVDGEREFIEIETQIDTVWFFPEYMLGVMYHRGYVEVEDSDGLDVKRLMVACEWDYDDPKPVEHYEEVMALRSDPQKAVAHVFNDSQLMPEKSAAQKAEQQQLIVQTKAEHKAKCDEIKAIKLAGLKAQYPDLDFTPPEAEPDEIPEPDPIPQQMIDDGDADLSPFLEYAEAKSAKAKTDMEAQLAEAQAQKAEHEAKASGPKEEPLESMQARVHSIVYVEAQDLQDKLVLVEPDWTQLTELDESQKAQMMEAAQQLQVNTRKARQQAPTVTTLALPLPENGALILRGWVLQLMQQNQSLAGRDLAGIDLSGLDLSSYDLRDVMLESANLSGCNFSHCRLDGAVLTGAILDGAIFNQASMVRTNLSQVKAKDSQFVGANMVETLMAQSVFKQCNFAQATLQKVMALKVDMSDCQLPEAVVSETHFVEAQLSDSQWQKASLDKCILMQNELPNSQWQEAKLHKCIVLQAKAAGADFSGVKANKVQFSNEGDFKGAVLSGGSWQVCGFRGLDMSEVDGRESVFKECDFAEANISDAQFNDALFDNSIMMKATMTNGDYRKAFFNGTSLRKAQLDKVDLRKTQWQDCDTTETVMERCRTWGFDAAPKPSIR